MKKLLALFFCFLILISAGGCKKEEAVSDRPAVTVNLPKDNTVNGYRVSNPETGSKDTASQKPEKTESKTESEVDSNQNIQYCANINSKVFHKPDCSSVKSTKEENKLFLSNRDELISLGYTPCKRCNP